jgi:sigma-B regulation protein RsbU (phosphoserine phosphatase)
MASSDSSRALLAKVRHDMRTPINHILGYSELLAEESDTIQAVALVEDLDRIRMAARNLLELIDTNLSDEGFDRLTLGEEVHAKPIATLPRTASLNGDLVASDDNDSHVTGRILVVDDNEENCQTLSRRLLRHRHSVAIVYNGMDALSRLRESPFDLVLLDVLMPGLDGYEVLRLIKTDSDLRHIPVIMVSALDEIESVVHCIESGAEDYLPKPFNPTLLRARIGASLEKKALRDDEQRHLRVIEETQNRLKHELDEAARYVRSIIPAPITEPVAIDWKYIPSTELGGDAFGYHSIDADHFAIYLLDVCGHGVGASLLSVTAMNVIRSGSLAGTDFREPSQVLSALNEAFPMERQNNMYFTIWYGVFNLRSRVLKHASGGHPPALLIGAEGVREIRSPGLLIGAMEGAVFASESLEVPLGARLLVFSDGVYEISRPDRKMVEFSEFKAAASEAAFADNGLDLLAKWAIDIHISETFQDDYSMLRVCF